MLAECAELRLARRLFDWLSGALGCQETMNRCENCPSTSSNTLLTGLNVRTREELLA